MKMKMKITAALLALMMLVSSVGLVFADDIPESGSENEQEATTPIVVIDGTAYTVNADGTQGDLCGSSEVNGDLTVNNYSPALEVRTGDAQQNSEFTVTGTVSDVVKVDSPETNQAVQAVAVQVTDKDQSSSDVATATAGGKGFILQPRSSAAYGRSCTHRRQRPEERVKDTNREPVTV